METNSISYELFLIFNSIGFFLSLCMVNFLTVGFPLQLELQTSLCALTVTYLFSIFSVVLPIIIPYLTMLLRIDKLLGIKTKLYVKTSISNYPNVHKFQFINVSDILLKFMILFLISFAQSWFTLCIEKSHG